MTSALYIVLIVGFPTKKKFALSNNFPNIGLMKKLGVCKAIIPMSNYNWSFTVLSFDVHMYKNDHDLVIFAKPLCSSLMHREQCSGFCINNEHRDSY